MILFNFIKWQYNRFNTEEKIFGFLIIFEILFVTVSVLAGISPLIILLFALVYPIVILVLALLAHTVKSQWDKFTEDMEEERDAIANKLRGKPINPGY